MATVGLRRFLSAVVPICIVLGGSTGEARGDASGGAGVPGEMSFYFSLGVKALYGKMASADSTTLVSRNLIDYGAEAVLGFGYGSWILGAGADYGMWRQLTKPDTISGSNTQGIQSNVSGILGYDFGWAILLGKYHFTSTYALDKKDTADRKVSFAEPEAPFSAQLMIPLSGGNTYLGIEYTSIAYTKQKNGTVETNLTGQTQLNTSAVGVVYAWIY